MVVFTEKPKENSSNASLQYNIDKLTNDDNCNLTAFLEIKRIYKKSFLMVVSLLHDKERFSKYVAYFFIILLKLCIYTILYYNIVYAIIVILYYIIVMRR